MESSGRARDGGLRKVDRPVRLAELAFAEIRAALLGERARAVDRLTEEELAQELSMSRTPVREALHRLALVGMVEPAPPGGYRRRRTTPRGVREHCELRLLLEPYAAELAATRARQDGGLGLAERVNGLDPSRPIGAAAFHLAIAEAAGSDSLPELIGELSDLAALDQAALASEAIDAVEWQDDHGAIVAAVEAGDAAAARAAMTAHLERLTAAMAAAIAARPEQTR